MKTNKTRIALKIVKMVKNLEPTDWCRVKSSVDDMYYALRFLKPDEQEPEDDIEEIEEEIEDNKC